MLIGPEDWRFSKSNADVLLSHYRAHNAAVKALVPKEKLLVYKIGDGWEPLCKFLGKPVPGIVLKLYFEINGCSSEHIIFKNKQRCSIPTWK